MSCTADKAKPCIDWDDIINFRIFDFIGEISHMGIQGINSAPAFLMIRVRFVMYQYNAVAKAIKPAFTIQTSRCCRKNWSNTWLDSIASKIPSTMNSNTIVTQPM